MIKVRPDANLSVIAALQGIRKEYEELDTVWYLAGRWATFWSRELG